MIAGDTFAIDDIAVDGVFVIDDGNPLEYDIRKYAGFMQELGLGPRDQLPDEYLELCRLNPDGAA